METDRKFLREAGIVPCDIVITPLEIVRLCEQQETTEERLSRAYERLDRADEENRAKVDQIEKLDGRIDVLIQVVEALALVVVLLAWLVWQGWH